MSMMLIDQTKDSVCKTAEADAIRAKTGGSAQIVYDWENNKGFADAIDAIPSGGDPWEKLLTVSANALTSLPSSSGLTHIRDYLFFHCGNLTNVDFSNISYVGEYSFSRCLVANDAVFEVPTAFWPQCFQRTRIPKVVAKKGTDRIDIYCFEQNSYLEAVDVSITSRSWSALNGIRASAFGGCPNLNALILRQDFFVSINTALPSNCGLSTSGNIYVPSALVATYKAATNWSTYADRILPIEGSYYETHWANGEAIA